MQRYIDNFLQNKFNFSIKVGQLLKYYKVGTDDLNTCTDLNKRINILKTNEWVIAHSC